MRPASATSLLLLTLLATSGCATLPQSYSASCEETPPVPITVSPDGTTASMRLDVLTYNIEGLQWPARSGRAPFLRQIGENLAELRKQGHAPDIVLFQEMFSRSASSAVLAADYPALATGPSRTQRRLLPRGGRAAGRASWRKGEIGLRFTSGGLSIASRYPIASEVTDPFSRQGCAGFDCLSNKGALLARIVIPGVPQPIDLVNTHMNAQGASKATPERRDTAHEVQSRELGEFIAAYAAPASPLLLAGDFNMRGSDRRFDSFAPSPRLKLVHHHCLAASEACEVHVSWDGDAPWMDTQDLQLFAQGTDVRVRPVEVDSMFDGRPESPKLSDHDGFRVIYELSWPAASTLPAGQCPAA